MTETHPNTRLEAFCDGVFAIALTLLIIDIRIPASDVIGTSPEMWIALRHLGPSIFAFVVSFTIIFITWVNHHAVSANTFSPTMPPQRSLSTTLSRRCRRLPGFWCPGRH